MKRTLSGAGEDRESPPATEFNFEEVVHLYRPRVFRYALAFLRDRDAAETITQDCFMRALNALGSFRQECSIQTWLMRIAVNLVRDHIKNRRVQFWKRTRATCAQPLETFEARGEGGRSPERSAILKEQVEAIWLHAGKLPNRQKTVFLLRFVEDLDILEIAHVTGMQEGTVKTHLFRALRTLRAAVTKAL